VAKIIGEINGAGIGREEKWRSSRVVATGGVDTTDSKQEPLASALQRRYLKA
jgi:hypothetical protein